MSFFKLDREKCKRCGLCIMSCPYMLFSKDEEGCPKAAGHAEQFCLSCGHCIAACPHDAIAISKLEEKSEPVDRSLTIDTKALEQFFKTRRSIRNYKDKEVPKEVLSQILDVTRWAPTAINLQHVHWLVFEKKEDVHRLAELTIEGMRKLNMMPTMVEAWEHGIDTVLRGAPNLIIAHGGSEPMEPQVDSQILLTQVDLLAPAYKLGTCWAGALLMVAAQYLPLMEAFGLPEGHKPYGALMIGYPKFKYSGIPPRKPAKIIWK